MDDLQGFKNQLLEGLDIKDRKWMMKTYHRCFIGSECVSWMVENGHATNRKDAVSLGNLLLTNGYFEHVTKDHIFKDENLYFRFKEHKESKERVKKVQEHDSWRELIPGIDESGQNLLPNIPHGFVDQELAQKLGNEHIVDMPLDEHNVDLLDNVHPSSWANPLPKGTYNMIAIGAGAGGLVTAAGSAGVGAKVAIIEKHMLGGDCLNYGCVPSKALLRTAKAISEIKHSSSLGIHIEGEISVDFPSIMERMRKLRAQISPNDSAKRFEDLGIDVFFGEAKFVSKDTVEVDGQTLKFHRCCIATGAKPAVPPIKGLDELNYLTNETLFNLTEQPRSMIIVGAGAIGCEMAQSFACFGTDTYLTCRSRVLAREEEKGANIVKEALISDGVNVIEGVKYEEFTVEENGDFTLHYSVDGEAKTITAEKVLVAVGRAPNVSALYLDKANVKFDARKGIHVNDQLVTSNKNIFAVGDCCTQYKFTHVADFMARIVIRNALFFGSDKFSNLVIPWATYTKPELAHVGLYESDMIERGIEYDVYEKDWDDLDRAILDSHEGYIKVFTKKGTDKIIGGTICGPRAGDMIGEISLAITNGIGLGAVALTIHPYPSESEAFRQVGDLFNRTRLTPTVKILFRKLMSMRRNTNV